MFGLSDIFTPSFFIILGILVLFIALLVVHIENKARVHEHKLNSMLSLVSSLAEEVNAIRYNCMMYPPGQGLNDGTFPFPGPGPGINENNVGGGFSSSSELISVSEDEDDDDDDEEDEEEDDDEDEDEDEEDDEDTDIEDDDNSLKTTIVKLNISKNNDSREEKNEIIEIGNDILDSIKVLKVDPESFPEEFAESLKEELAEELAELEEYLEEEKNEFDIENVTSKIIINKIDELIDYKKLPLQRLKTIVMEKNLVEDSSKLKKHELLKLLGIE
jgi:hypothetical protein